MTARWGSPREILVATLRAWSKPKWLLLVHQATGLHGLGQPVSSRVVPGKFGSDRLKLPITSCRLNRSMQHWLAVYSPAFESPRSLADVVCGAGRYFLGG